MNVAVIGAGWAGLACAVELASKNISVTVFEAGRIAGGRARTVALNGRNVDNGQHLLLGAYSSTLALMKRVGADPDALCLRTPLEVAGAQGFKLSLPRLTYPLNLAWGLFSTQGIRLRHKFATLMTMGRLQRQGFDLPESQSVKAWLDATQADNPFCKHLWEPLCLAAMNTPAERASAHVFAKVLRDSLGNPEPGATDLLFPKAPLGKLFPEPALAYLISKHCTVKFSHRVRQLCQDGDVWRVDGLPFSQVVLATAPQHLPALLQDLPTVTAAPYDYEAIATLYLEYQEPVSLPTPLFHLGGTGQWIVSHAPLGRPQLLACVLSGNGAWSELPESALLEVISEEIRHNLPRKTLPQLRWHRLIREQRATFSCRPGLKRQEATSGLKGLHIAGDHIWKDYPATLEAACRSGLAAAQNILGKSA